MSPIGLDMVFSEKFVRFSDEELAEFREIINEKKVQAEKDIEHLKSLYRNDSGNGTEDTTPQNKSYDEGSEVNNKETHAANAARLQKYVHDLNNALNRIKNKTYGRCKVTGERIDPERLRLAPHTMLSMEGKGYLDRREKGIYKK